MKRKKPKTGLWGHKALIIIGTIVVTLYAAAGYKASHAKPVKPPVPVYYEHAADAMPFPATLDPASLSVQMYERHIKWPRKSQECSSSSPAIAIANGKDTGACSIASVPSTQLPATSASKKPCSPAKCMVRENRRKKFGQQSFATTGHTSCYQQSSHIHRSTTKRETQK